MIKKIIALTGIRSEYDLLKPVLSSIQADGSFDLSMIVSGTHLSDHHNYSASYIENDGFRIADRLDSLFMTSRLTQRSKGVGVLTYALSQTIEREKPDFLLVVGDREEGIAAALVGIYMNVLVVHMGGGDSAYGNTDDSIRFAISKLAHVHCTFSRQSADNLLSIGEEEFRVFFVGNPLGDQLHLTAIIPASEIAEMLSFEISDGRYVVLIQHPLSSEWKEARAQMQVTLEAIAEFCRSTGFRCVCIHPNADPGAEYAKQAMLEYEGDSWIRFVKNLPHSQFVNVIRNARAIVGNSSMGVLEAPFYGMPVVNIGNRQMGREHAGNVTFVPHSKNAIIGALQQACMDNEYRQEIANLDNPFSTTNTSKKILDILSSIDPSDTRWKIKKNSFAI